MVYCFSFKITIFQIIAALQTGNQTFWDILFHSYSFELRESVSTSELTTQQYATSVGDIV